MSKLKFILLIVIFISIISVTLAETNQSATADIGGISQGERITILSLILVVISLLLGHYMDDHDAYMHRLIGFQARYGCFKSSDELSDHIKSERDNKNDEKVLNDCILFHLTLMHFGSISFTLIICFLVATSIATCLIIETIPSCEPSLTNLNLYVSIIIFIIILLLFQLWSFLRQGNMIARWVNDFKKIEFRKKCRENCRDYPETTFPRNKRAEWLTTMRLWLAELKVGIIDGTTVLVVIWFIILLFFIYIFCW